MSQRLDLWSVWRWAMIRHHLFDQCQWKPICIHLKTGDGFLAVVVTLLKPQIPLVVLEDYAIHHGIDPYS